MPGPTEWKQTGGTWQEDHTLLSEEQLAKCARAPTTPRIPTSCRPTHSGRARMDATTRTCVLHPGED